MSHRTKPATEQYKVIAELIKQLGQEEPFQRIDLESGTLRARFAESAKYEVDTLEDYLDQARAFYADGDINTAILWTWYAGLQTAKLVNSEAHPLRDTQGASMRLMELAEQHLPAGKVLRRKVQNVYHGKKGVIQNQWNNCFQSVPGFRDWGPTEQRDYLREQHADVCGETKVKKDTLRSYCTKFQNLVRQKNNG